MTPQAPRDASAPQVAAHWPRRYPRLPARHRLLLVLLALATTVMLWFALIYRPGDAKRGRAPAPPADKGVCVDGRSSGCVGGTAMVIPVAPRAAPASAP